MKKLLRFIKWFACPLLIVPTGCGQNPTGVHVKNPEFDRRLSYLLRFDVPVISVDSLFSEKEHFIILDTRTLAEFQVSHIPDARFLDFSRLDYSLVKDIPKQTPIVVYCSVGYRSEKIGKKLLNMGFTQVFNLYGSIFEWVNEGYPVVNPMGQPTDTIHTYNKRWSQYVYNPAIIKTW